MAAIITGGLMAALAGALAAQAPAGASPFLPAEHWARDALTRLQAAGFVGSEFDPATASIRSLDAVALFGQAAQKARPASRGWASLAAAWHDRLAEEFPANAARTAGASGPGVERRLSAGLGIRSNGLLARHHTEEGGGSAVELEDLTAPAGELGFDLLLPAGGVALAARGAVAYDGEDWRVSEVYGVLQAGRIGFWLGRRPIGFGTGQGGSLVLNPLVAMDGGGLFLPSGVPLPGFLSFLGRLHFESTVARMEWSGNIDSPWFFNLRTSVAPHDRVRIGINRGTFFAGANNEARPTLGRVLSVLAGIETKTVGRANFENHVASVDLWVAPHLGTVPLVLYGEWGVEDISRKTTDMPALLLGGRFPGLPGLEEVNLGLEWTWFGRLETTRPWYDHRIFGTWTDGGRPLGHPLGGTGREWRAYGGIDLTEARVRLDASTFGRRRKPGNLYAPEREGRSRGVEGGLGWRAARSMELVGRASYENGDGWDEGSGFVGGRFFF